MKCRPNRGGRQVLVAAASVIAALAAAGPAAASNLTLNIGAQVSSTPASCTLFAPFASGSGLSDGEDCTGDTGMAIFANSRSLNQSEAGYTITAPAGITINQVWVPIGDLGFFDPSGEYDAGEHWANGGDVHWSAGQTAMNTIDQTSNINSSYWQFWLSCTATAQVGGGFGCPEAADANIGGLHVYATETTAPSLIATSSNNLWYQAGNWVWNTPSDVWPAAISGSDSTGICNAYVQVDNTGPPLMQPQSQAAWQQCPQLNWSAPTVNTSQYVPTSGQVSLTLSDTNAAGLSTTDSETLNVDNVQPTVALATPNDSDPGGWSVNHAVTVHVTPTTGPSGLSSLTCAVDGHAAQLDSRDDLTVNGNGQHSINCTAANSAIDPQGQHNTGNAAMTVDIDEQPPTVSLEAQNPSDPDQVIAQTSDNESQVAGGQIEIAPHGTSSWSALPTTFTSGGQLIAMIPDATLHGPYTIQASACSQVGNCGSTSETLTMPLRLATSSEASFTVISAPAKIVKERVLVDWHWKRERRHGKLVRVRAGGHDKTIMLVIPTNASCATKQVKTGKDRWEELRVCRALKIDPVTSTTVAYGKQITVNGLLLTAQGAPIANAPVTILTAPDNGSNQFTPTTTATTSSSGSWSATLPAGPSRLIEASYAGSQTLLPATGTASVTVPASIQISITPRSVSWSKPFTATGQLLGGDVPPDGVAMRLLIKLPERSVPYEPLPFRTNSQGAFSFQWLWGSGSGVVSYPIAVATTANESDYPYAASSSRWVKVTFGKTAPAAKTKQRAVKKKRAAKHQEPTTHHPPKSGKQK
ncbi:MAG: hypothetical protein ACLP0J_30480 [Solirubrobacteraceae bacterium]